MSPLSKLLLMAAANAAAFVLDGGLEESSRSTLSPQPSL